MKKLNFLFLCFLVTILSQSPEDYFNEEEWQGYADVTLKDITTGYVSNRSPKYRVYWNVTENDVLLGVFTSFFTTDFPASLPGWSGVGFSWNGLMAANETRSNLFIFNETSIVEWVAFSSAGMDEDFSGVNRVDDTNTDLCINGQGAVCPVWMVESCGEYHSVITYSDWKVDKFPVENGFTNVHAWMVRRNLEGYGCISEIPFDETIYLIGSFGQIQEGGERVYPFSITRHFAVSDENFLNPFNIKYILDPSSVPVTTPPSATTPTDSTTKPTTTTTPSPTTTARVPTTRPSSRGNSSNSITFSFVLIFLVNVVLYFHQ